MKDSCYRFLAEPNDNQIYMLFPNICHQENDYEWYWEHKTELVKKEEDNT